MSNAHHVLRKDLALVALKILKKLLIKGIQKLDTCLILTINIWLNTPASVVANQEIRLLFRSGSGEFAFGFRRFQINEKENQFLLSFRSANGEKLAPQGSKLTQNSSSALVLNGPDGHMLWKAPPSHDSNSSCVAILGNGSSVILDDHHNSIWESFENPTDTILPG
ncbi:g-type lectin s-receptor-like serine/threonine-protein kinase rlk1 [Quercus suber]|uniref:G-type lectin s-receptor-like serine/threonine-protein kinase rlk1 n=1 Tax=Quercus suber TaxID=58331 RepID=A0AAW0JX30_QUESU